MDIITVFAVIHQCHTITGLGKICPFVCAYLESCTIPGCVLVCRPLYIAELDLIIRFMCQNIHREGYSEQLLMFLPVHSGLKIDPCGVPVETNGLFDHGILEPPAHM